MSSLIIIKGMFMPVSPFGKGECVAIHFIVISTEGRNLYD